MADNDWCKTLGITTPKLEAVAGHREANTFALLLVALVERGGPMTLVEVAARFEEAGIADRARALRSLQRCKPGRPPIYREDDRYHLDPHDDELSLWMFRLGLRPPRVARVARKVADPSPLPGPDVALSDDELDEAWRGAVLSNWSAKRLAVAVLDAFGEPRRPSEVVAAVTARTKAHRLAERMPSFERGGNAVQMLTDGRWAITPDADETVAKVRDVVRARIADARRRAATRPDPEEFERNRKAWEAERAARGAEIARLTRALVVAFPPNRPEAAALLDVQEHELSTYVGDELAELRARLERYEIIGAVDVRSVLRALDFDPGERRLAELGPPQKTRKLNKRGRTLKITTALLVQGSCGISRPFGQKAKLAEYIDSGETTKLRRRLEADAKSLFALYEYGRLHGVARLRWGFLDECLPVPWVHRDEPTLPDLKKSALATNVPLEVIVGSAPGWREPWSRVRRARVEQGANMWRSWLVDAEDGAVIDDADVQRARLAKTEE